MNNFWIFGFVLVILSQDTAMAAGAVAASKQKQQMTAQQQMMMQQQMQQQQMQGAQNPSAPPPKVEDVVDITQLWAQLETSSEAWSLIIDPEVKVATVAHYIEVLGKDGIKIKKAPEYYAQMIESMAAQSPDLLKNPFTQILTMVAVLEYDYGNGQDPDETARKFLGQERYMENKRRLGLSQ